MRKEMLFLILALFFNLQPAEAETYYITPTGAGDHSGSSESNAMSADDFNNPDRWSMTDDPNKLDPDDIVYPKGRWDSASYNLVPVHGITIDLYEDGDYDPATMSQTMEPFFTYSKIIVQTDGVTVQDGRFNNDDFTGAGKSIDASSCECKISNLVVKRNLFYTKSNYEAAVDLGFVCDSEISHNYFYTKISSDICRDKTNTGRSMFLYAGSRNKINHNYIEGGYTAIIFLHKTDFNGDGDSDVPSAGHYTADPDYNYEDNEIGHNIINGRCEEGISYDVSSSSAQITIIERDTVLSVDGETVTLDNNGGEGPGGEWTGVGNRYSGYYMTAITDRDDTYGHHALIETQDDNVFTLAEPIENLQPGDVVVIGFAFRHNWIHDNTFQPTWYGFGDSSILLEGMALENLVENNYLPPKDATNGFGIKVSSLYQYTRASSSVTRTYASEPAAYNIVRNNTCGALVTLSWHKDYGPGDLFFTRNNAIIDNTMHQVYYDRRVQLKWSTAYLSGNDAAPPQIVLGSTVLESDPTTHVAEYFDNWPNYEQMEPCESDWDCSSCTSWSACADNKQERECTCTDSNFCESDYIKTESQSCSILEEGILVAHYDFDDVDDALVDISGNGYDGAIYSNPALVEGISGTALHFDGVDDYVDTGLTEHLAHWTVSVWTMGDNLPAGGKDAGPVMKEENFILSWYHGYTPCRNALCFRVASTWYPATFGDLHSGTWYQLAATYDGQTLRAYKDGVLITENTDMSGDSDSSDHPMTIAKHSVVEKFYDGSVDEVRVYNYALSEEEILSLFEEADCISIDELVALVNAWTQGNADMGEVLRNAGRWLECG